ncbi:MAG TPA: Gfo/Idh/MocA family oxidoreductase [Gaiellales bacterium]|nr:Gfo/Idh/MocA family oxidoreductase [Gaiellales bacterium]
MSAEAKVRVGLVGCGYWGPKVIRAAASLPDVEVAALVDLREDLREVLGRHYPLARSTATLGEALAGGPLDAVIVATNPATHVEVASEAIAGGCHVMVEKPLALSAAACRDLGVKARAAGVILMAGHTFRFSPLVNHVRSLVESGELGEIYSVDSQRLNLGRVRRDVDAIWNFAPHDISILNYWLDGHPRAVHCHAYDYLQPGIPDLAFLVLEYEHAVAHVHISWLHPSKVRRMTVIGSKKMVVYDDVEGQIVVHDAGIDREHVDRSFPDFETFGEFRLIQRVGDMHIPRIPVAEPLALQCRHFVDCVKNGTEPVTDFEDAARVVEVLEAASASHAKGGARVEIADLA